MTDVGVYTIADARYFVGLLGLVGSLRANGVTAPVHVLDLGLTHAQRTALGSTCRFSCLPCTEGRDPWLLSAFPSQLAPDGVVAYLDADVIVTAPLDGAFAAARAGAICVGIDPVVPDRWFAQWEGIFALRAPLRREPYVNSGAVVFSAARHPDVLPRWWECSLRVDRPEVSRWGWQEDPEGLADQDAFNALLMSEIPAGTVVRLPGFVHDPVLSGATVADVRRLACRVGSTPVVLIQSLGTPKPWAPRAWRALRSDAYVRCLREVLRRLARPGPGPLSVDPRTVPAWLRPGAVGVVANRAGFAWSWCARRTRGIRRRIRRAFTRSG